MKVKCPTHFVLLVAILPTLATGCVVTASVPPHVRHAQVVVLPPPPPPRIEVVHVSPHPGYVWIGGHWTWNGHRHYWIPGYWTAPRHGHRHVPHRWERHGHGWREHPGRWVRHGERY